MVPQVILTLVNGRGTDRPVLDATRLLVERYNAHADIALLCPDPLFAIPYLGEGFSGGVVNQLLSQVEAENTKRAEKARESFQNWRDDAGLVLADSRANLVAAIESDKEAPSCSWSEHIGAPDDLAAAMGRLADIIVHAHAGSFEETETTFEAALMESGRPLFLVPQSTSATIGNSIVIAWDGSAESARAAGAALPLLSAAETVTIVSVVEEGKDIAGTEHLARYLSWHGITANTRLVDAGDRSVGEAVLDVAKQESSDLLVMGAYGHNRYRELIFGGTTRHVLEHCALPVLLAH